MGGTEIADIGLTCAETRTKQVSVVAKYVPSLTVTVNTVGPLQRSLGKVEDSSDSTIYQPIQLLACTLDFARFAPINKQHYINVAFTTFHLGYKRLPHAQPICQLHLGKPRFPAQRGQACLQGLITRVINSDRHQRMLYPCLE